MASFSKTAIVMLVLTTTLLHGAMADIQPQQSVPAYATEIVPGVGTDDAPLGESLDKFFRDYKLVHRSDIITSKHIISGKVCKVEEITYEEDSGTGTPMHTVDFMFVDGKLVQFGTSERQIWVSIFGKHRPSLSEVILHAPASRVQAYLQYSKDSGGEFIRYYYDDVKEGLALATDTQDESANSDAIIGRNPSMPGTFYPDWVIVHRRGALVIPIHSTEHYKPVKVETCMSMGYLLSHLHTKLR